MLDVCHYFFMKKEARKSFWHVLDFVKVCWRAGLLTKPSQAQVPCPRGITVLRGNYSTSNNCAVRRFEQQRKHKRDGN